MAEEASPGGSRIYRHAARPRPDEPRTSSGDADLVEAVGAHLEHCFGEADGGVFHEIVSPMVHVDVRLVLPTDAFPFQRLVTSGMAEAPMTVPAGFPETTFAELTLALPRDWPMDEEAFKDERVYWPIRLLKGLARLPMITRRSCGTATRSPMAIRPSHMRKTRTFAPP